MKGKQAILRYLETHRTFTAKDVAAECGCRVWHDHQLHHEERSRAGEGQQARAHQQSLANGYLSPGYAGRAVRYRAQLQQWNISGVPQ